MDPFYTKIRTYKKRIIRYRPFILIGNEIDGRIFSGTFFEFNSLSDLKRKLPDILTSIKGEGEWIFELYQVPRKYKIRFRWGYYRYPSPGTKIFTYNYCSSKIESVEFIGNKLFSTGIDNFTYKNVYPSVVRVEINAVELEFES